MSGETSAQAGWSRAGSPFHAGELAIQERLGVRDKIEAMGRRSIRDYMPDQHRDFFAQLPFLLAGLVDADGQPWATVLVGQPGFARSPDPWTLHIAAQPSPNDPALAGLREGAAIGLLGLDPTTRRRNRLNGTVADLGANGFAVVVQQSFGNCPQYIQARAVDLLADHVAGAVVHGAGLDAAARALIGEADTFFIASAHRDGVDVSHRGGKPGFVRVDDDGTLTAADFVGNFLFNTLGNLTLDPRAGLLFIDFDSGDLLYVAARAEIVWDGPEVRAFAGAERLLRFHVAQTIRLGRALPLHWSAPEFSPLLARVGSWEEAERSLGAERNRSAWRSFTVARTEDESETIRSFYLAPADGGGVATYETGQHLPIRLPGGEVRTYTLSDAPNGRDYRISVRRQGAASSWLHAQAAVGARIEAMAPRGSFIFDRESRRPVALVSAGVGITPMIAMLNALLVNDGRTRHHARIHFIHGARHSGEHAFAAQLREKARLHSNLSVHVRYSAPRPGDAPDSVGHVDLALLKAILPFDDYDFYLCGPAGFMQSLYDGLHGMGIADARIRFEAFGPASVKRTLDPAAATVEAVDVTFARSGRTAKWRPGDGSLLELAEAHGLSPLYSCRAGICGTCATRVVSGGVDYAEAPAAEVAAGEALICCSTPHPGLHLEGMEDREGVVLDL